MLEARLVLAGDSGFRVYIINHVYIALRYRVCVDNKILYDTFCGNVGQSVIFSLTFSHFLSISLSIPLSLSISLSLYLSIFLSLSLSLSPSLYPSLSLGLSFPFHELIYIRTMHSPIGSLKTTA